MIGITKLTDEQMESIRHILPGPDPKLAVRPDSQRSISVADTKLDGNEMKYLTECISSNWISSVGPFVKRFEERFARSMGCEYGVACSNGTVALHLALATLGMGPEDEVIIPAFTMIATANAVRYTGARSLVVDAEPETWNINPDLIEAAITDRTKAIVVVHTYGHPVEMDPILEIAKRYSLYVIEDAAEAHGAHYHERPVGSLGHMATFSFYANKIITTGEGGMLTTNDSEIAAIASRLRDHAFSSERHFWHEYPGFNYRMTNLQAAIGLAQTERLDDLVAIRREHARQYSELLRAVPGLSLPVEKSGAKSVFWMYGLVVQDEFGLTRDQLRATLAAQGIETRTFFIPIHLQPIFFAQFSGQRFPVAEMLCQRGMYLPSGPSLTTNEISIVASAIADAQSKKR